MKRIATMLGFPLKSINPSNAKAKLRANPTKCERSELPKIARQLQRSLDGTARRGWWLRRSGREGLHTNQDPVFTARGCETSQRHGVGLSLHQGRGDLACLGAGWNTPVKHIGR